MVGEGGKRGVSVSVGRVSECEWWETEASVGRVSECE